MVIAEIRDLLAKGATVTFDEGAVEGAKLRDLDLKSVEQSFAGFRAVDGESSANISILLDHKVLVGTIQSYSVTLAGWLAFSNNPQSNRKFNHAIIEFQQFRSTTREHSIKKMEIVGTLPQQINLAIDTLMQHVWTVPKIKGAKRQDIPAYDRIST